MNFSNPLVKSSATDMYDVKSIVIFRALENNCQFLELETADIFCGCTAFAF